MLNMPSMDDFDRLTKAIRKQVRKYKIKPADVESAIKQARKK